MKHSKYILVVALTMGAFAGVVNAQEKISHKIDYTFERIEQISPWLTSNNGAGLLFNKTPDNFSSVYGYFNNENGKLRNYNDAKSLNNFGLATKSYYHLGKFHFYGLFNYDYTTKKDQTWLGTVYQGTSLAPIVEDVPGKVIKEDYILSAKIAYDINSKFAAGIAFDYTDATANKKRDGRNSSTYSDFVVAPGISYKTPHLNLGLTFNYGYNTENINYEYIGDAAGKYIYYMEGLFMYTNKSITASGITLDRRYQKNSFGGSMQAEFVFGPLSFYNNFYVNYSKTNNYEDKSLVKRYSYAEGLEYKYNGVLKATCDKLEQNLYLGFSSTENLLYNISNIYEEVPGENGLWQYYEYGNTLRYRDLTKEYHIALNGLCKRNEYLPNFEYTIGFRFNDIDKIHKVYPAKYEQTQFIREYYASLSKNFATCDKGYLSITLNGSFRNGNGTPLNAVNPILGSSLKLQQDLLATDYAFNTAKRYNLGFSLKYNYYMNREKGMSCWIKGDYNYTKVSGWSDYKNGATEAANELLSNAVLLSKGDNRSFIGFSLGFNF